MTTWTPLFGDFAFAGTDEIIFNGKQISFVDENQVQHSDGAAVGLALCDIPFLSGTISTTINIDSPSDKLIAAICIAANPSAGSQLLAGIGSFHRAMFAITAFDGKKWVQLENGQSGEIANIQSNTDYRLAVTLTGQKLAIRANGVVVVDTLLSGNISGLPIGVYAMSKGRVTFKDFKVAKKDPKAFVVMQFTTPYNELYESVIKPVCSEVGLTAFRVDEQYGPGLIINDITQQINESAVVIAEITPGNPNVYYEVGYAHAIRKPTILIAERGIKLPFDVSPFRVLMYENTIDGKSKIESGLRAHLGAIFKKSQE